MSIYSTSNYRKIWEEANNAKIPKGYHIHHIDGNHNNNNPDNLLCVSVQEHFNIHKSQGDWGACYLFLRNKCLILTPEERSDIARKTALERMKAGTHNFIGSNEKRIKDGTNNFLGGDMQRKNAIKDIENGTHNFIVNHPTKQIVTCPHCNKSGPKPQMLQWHFDKCKSKK